MEQEGKNWLLMSWLQIMNDTTEFWMFVNHWLLLPSAVKSMWGTNGTREWKDFKIKTRVCFFHSPICLLHLTFQSPSFLLSRLHSPPPQSNWFRSTSWGGYGVGMWAFCFHLSVNSGAVKKKKRLNLDCNSVPRSHRGIHQSWWLQCQRK